MSSITLIKFHWTKNMTVKTANTPKCTRPNCILAQDTILYVGLATLAKLLWWWWQQEPPSQAQWFYEWDIFLGQRSLSQRITSHYLSHHPTLSRSVFVIPHTFTFHISAFILHISHLTFHVSQMLSNTFLLFKQVNSARFDAITLYKSSSYFVDISIRQITSISNAF